MRKAIARLLVAVVVGIVCCVASVWVLELDGPTALFVGAGVGGLAFMSQLALSGSQRTRI